MLCQDRQVDQPGAQMRPQETRAIKFDREDDQLLIQLAKAEKLTASDIVRRAVRAYAKQLGVTAHRDGFGSGAAQPGR